MQRMTRKLDALVVLTTTSLRCVAIEMSAIDRNNRWSVLSGLNVRDLHASARPQTLVIKVLLTHTHEARSILAKSANGCRLSYRDCLGERYNTISIP